MGRVLVVDDEVKLGRILGELFEADGHDVVVVRGGREALVELATRPCDVLLTDLRMPEVDGFAVLAAARALPHPPEVVVMTAYASTESAVTALRDGASDYLIKPFALDEARHRVRRLLDARRTRLRAERLGETLKPNLIAESPAMKKVLEMARRVAPTDTSVLILGPTGTGKSQLAKYIHYCSARSDGALQEVQCASLSETLLESELFGHKKGAFTGALEERKGQLRASEGGTLFLDEIGEVSLATQVKLLRFLQSREFVPVGGNQAERVDTRIIAAGNRDLEAAVRDGTFREDFFYRLNVFALHVPPLKERPEDVLPLVERFLESKGVPFEKFTDGARGRAVAYDWRGNVRELENAIERALILAGPDDITADHLGSFRKRPPPGGPATSPELAADALLTEGFDLDAFEASLLQAALQRTGGNKAAAARLLGITRRRLYSRLHSLGAGTAAAEPDAEESG